MFSRLIDAKIKKMIHTFRCLSLCGARQVGKSFYLRQFSLEENGIYQTMDDPLVRKEAEDDPIGWIRRHRKPGFPLIIDEAVKCPDLFNAVKIIVDEEDPVPTKIVLASSSNYLLLRQIKESLAGRVGLLNLYPLSWLEVAGREKTLLSLLLDPEKICHEEKSFSVTDLNRERTKLLLHGGFPEIQTKLDWEFTSQWSSQYFSTYILPLAVELFRVAKQNSFEQVFRQLCLRSSQLTNFSAIANSTDVSSVTVKNHVHYLEAMMVCRTLNQFHRNRIKRLVKSPKIHLMDPLFVNWNFNSPRDLGLLKRAGIDGALYESWIVSEITKSVEYESLNFELTTWHTQDKAEVDLIISTGIWSIPLEIKFKPKITRRDLSGLKSWMESHNHESPIGYIVYTGSKLEKLDHNIWAIPDYYLLGIAE